MAKRLSVFLHRELVGTLTQDQGHLGFRYEDAWLSREDKRPLFLSLPLRRKTFNDRQARAAFSGLLPDEDARRRLARALQVSDENEFALLEAVGGECAGAIAFYPEGERPEEPKRRSFKALSDHQLAEAIRSLPSRPLLAGGPVRLSLAGAQDKMLVCLIQKKVALPSTSFPSTHILKPAIERLNDTVHNEFFCMSLAARLELSVPETELRAVEGVPYLLVKRYDRTPGKDGVPARLHQEDFCQALGILPWHKYEREGGPSLKSCFGLLSEHSTRPASDRIALLKGVIFNYLIGNADAHGKNFSLLHTKNGTQLAPFYDLLSTEVYSGVDRKMAMKIGGHYKFEEVLPRHWDKCAQETGLAPILVRKELDVMSEEIVTAAKVEKGAMRDLGASSSIFDQIATAIEKRASLIRERLGFADGPTRALTL